jgi:hypothetical protein
VRALGSVPGTELHHIVEQSQAKSTRSGFSIERINTTDNLTRIPTEVHREISRLYSTRIFRGGKVLRNELNDKSWEYQTEVGRRALDRLTKEADDGR